MKVPKAKKLPSGSWFVRLRINGGDIGITRPTEKEAIAEAMAIKAGIKTAEKQAEKVMTLREAIDRYIEIRTPVLSPSTIRGYRIIQANRLQLVMDRPLSRLRDVDFQWAINSDVKTCSAKTIRNTWGFVSSVLREQSGRVVHVSLPQIVQNEKAFLQPEQIPVFLDAIRGNKHEAAILLGLHGLRVSEILAVRRDDIDLQTKMIAIHGSAVPDEHNKLQYKETNKNTASRRIVPILIPRLAEILEMEEYAKDDFLCVAKSSGALYYAVNRTCEKAKLPAVGVHGLRHSFASLCYHLGLPEATTMRLGGWSNPGTMRKIYTHLADQDLAEQTKVLSDFFAPKNGNENGNE